MRRILLFLFAVLVVTAWTLPSYAAEVNFGGAWRIRAFAIDNEDYSENSSDSNSFVEQRMRLNIDARSSEDFGGHVLLEGGTCTWGDGTTNGCGNATATKTGLKEFWLDFNIVGANVKIGTIKLKVPGDINCLVLCNRKDGAIVSSNVGPATVYAALIKNDEANSTNDSDPTAADDDDNTYLVGGQFSPAKGTSAGVFYIYNREASATITTMHWIGANASTMAGPVDLDIEGVILTGDIDGGNDISGFALVGHGSIAPTDQLMVGLYIAYGSGDDNSTDTDNEAFQAHGGDGSFQPTGNSIWFDNGLNDWGGATPGLISTNLNQSSITTYRDSVGNTLAFIPYATFKVNDTIKIMGSVEILQQVEDTPSSGNGGAGDDSIGTGVNLGVNKVILSGSSLSLTAWASWFLPGDGILASSSADDDAITEYTASLQYSF